MCVLITFDLGRSESKTHTFYLQKHFCDFVNSVCCLVCWTFPFIYPAVLILSSHHMFWWREQERQLLCKQLKDYQCQWRVWSHLPKSLFWYVFYSSHAVADSSGTTLRWALHYQSNIKPVFPPDRSCPNGESEEEVWKEEEVTGRVCMHKHN